MIMTLVNAVKEIHQLPEEFCLVTEDGALLEKTKSECVYESVGLADLVQEEVDESQVITKEWLVIAALKTGILTTKHFRVGRLKRTKGNCELFYDFDKKSFFVTDYKTEKMNVKVLLPKEVNVNPNNPKCYWCDTRVRFVNDAIVVKKGLLCSDECAKKYHVTESY